MDEIHVMATLPEQRLLECLAVIDLATLRRFHAYYGIDEKDPDSGDLIPIDAHAICLWRLHRRAYKTPRLPRHATSCCTTITKSVVMATRNNRQPREALMHPADTLQSRKRLSEAYRRLQSWGVQGCKFGPMVADDAPGNQPLSLEHLRLLRSIQQAEARALGQLRAG